jgi:hypothetical protein
MRRAVVGLLALAAGCSSSEAADGSLAVVWDTAFVYRAAVEDTALINPVRLARFRDGVVALDGQEPRVTAFGPDGRVRWIYAHWGEATGDLSSTVDALETSDGLWVLDWRGHRVVLLSDAGAYVRELPLPAQLRSPGGMVAGAAGEAVLLDGTELMRVSLADGAVVDARTEVPWTRPPPSAWPKLARLTGSGPVTAIGMSYGPEIVVLEDGRVRAAVVDDGVPYQVRASGPPAEGGTRIPQLSSMRVGVAAMRIVDDQLWVLTGGDFRDPEARNDLLVAYSLDGTRLGERELPTGALDFLATGDLLFVLPFEAGVARLLALGRPRF